MFLKPANSEMENSIQKVQKLHLKNLYTTETGKWKSTFEKYQNNTSIE